MVEGIYPIYKEKGPTSNRVLQEIKRIVGKKKIGHAGTLDPLAQGVLVVAIGREFTKKLGIEVKKEKEYVADIRLGMTSSTDDEEGEKTILEVKNEPDLEDVKKVISQFIGEISQIPPAYSAIKINGKEAYKIKRQGGDVLMKPRSAVIKDIEIVSYEWPNLKIKVVTGPGVYIRALARDIGSALGVGGYLAGLLRTRVGDFTLESALKIIELKKPI